MFNAFEELFAPGRKHTRDEQNRLELTREDVGDADPGHGPIDLTSGKVVVRPSPDRARGVRCRASPRCRRSPGLLPRPLGFSPHSRLRSSGGTP
ncbi:DUF6191 domain-containing protein [Streptomyces hirsutus]|uniref:DUF6191 domain-containing protein n=1 Tax=Streptomyces hirsutus TaxID=35620 RepID=UPI0033DC7FF6